VGALPVCEGQRLVGMVTDRNITIRATAYGHDPNTTAALHYLSSDFICCFEDQDIKEAEELMRQRRVRRLPILTREKQIAGIVALDDLTNRTVGTREPTRLLDSQESTSNLGVNTPTRAREASRLSHDRARRRSPRQAVSNQ